MAARRNIPAQQNASDDVVYELRHVPPEKVAQVVDDFLSESPANVEKVAEPDGTYTIRVRRLSSAGV
jgi:hypothetical protein